MTADETRKVLSAEDARKMAVDWCHNCGGVLWRLTLGEAQELVASHEELRARLAELEAELAKTRASDDYHADALRRVLQESNHLRANLEHLAQECGPSCAKDIADLRAQLARKEEALTSIELMADTDPALSDIRDIARAALGEVKT